MERFVMSSQFQLIVFFFLLYSKVLKVPQPQSAVTISRIARDHKVKPQLKPEKVNSFYKNLSLKY